MKNPFSPFALLGRFTVGRFFLFRKELMVLWRAFRHSDTPFHLKVMMLAVPLYLISPIDIIPDVLPFVGILDDFVIVPMLMSWIVSMLPEDVRMERKPAYAHARSGNGQTINGTARRR